MSDIIDISQKHGEAMYLLGLKHALEIVKILGDNAAEHLEAEIKEASHES